MTRCILCNNDDLVAVAQIRVGDLCEAYKRWQRYDISKEFEGIKEIHFLQCGKCGLKFFEPPLVGSAEFYATISSRNRATYYQESKSEYEFAQSYITKDDSILDIGAGEGHFAKFVAGSYTGLEINRRAVAVARGNGIDVREETIETHAEVHGAEYSVVTCFQVLEHVRNAKAFTTSCLNSLKKGGLLIVSVPSEDSWVPWQVNALSNMPPHHISRWTDTSLRNLAGVFALELVAMEHEQLAQVHTTPFCQCLARQVLKELLYLRRREDLVDLSLRSRILGSLSCRVGSLLARAVEPWKVALKGHSVSAVYRK